MLEIKITIDPNFTAACMRIGGGLESVAAAVLVNAGNLKVVALPPEPAAAPETATPPKKRGRKPKPAPAAAAVPVTPEPSPEPPPATPEPPPEPSKPETPEITAEMIRARLHNYISAHSKDEAKALLDKYGAGSVSTLKRDDFAAIYADLGE